MGNPQTQIAIVGPCASGKSTLAANLVEMGYQARQIAQEHSYVPNMWQVITKPEALVYLDASFETCTERKSLSWSQAAYRNQIERLVHAREHCDIYVLTDDLTPEEVLQEVLAKLKIGQSP